MGMPAGTVLGRRPDVLRQVWQTVILDRLVLGRDLSPWDALHESHQ